MERYKIQKGNIHSYKFAMERVYVKKSVKL